MNGNETPEKFGLISRVNITTRIMLRLSIYSASMPLPLFHFIKSAKVNFGLIWGWFQLRRDF